LDHSSLVALFRRIVLAGPPLLLGTGFSAGCVQCPGSAPVSERTETVVLSPTDLPADAGGNSVAIDELIARCQASSSDCMPLCEQLSAGSPFLESCKLVTVDGGLEAQYVLAGHCAGGRCPEGLAAPMSPGARDPLGAWLAANAHLEAASIDAFEILTAELGAHRAPPALIRAARAAGADEYRHAEIVGRLAAQRGAVPPAAQVNRGPIRDLESVARENAVEGCVRETYAVVLALRQGCAATDPAIRSAMAGIARDEARHAALAWAVDAWSRALLTPAARRRVSEARHEAFERLITAPLANLSCEDRELAGLPDEDAAAQMARELGEALG
jgi:hypothetical protein